MSLVSRIKPFLCLGFLACLLIGLPLFPQRHRPKKQVPEPGEFKIIYNNAVKDKDTVFATGNVEVHYKDITVFADKAQVNTKTKDVYAEGNVSVQTPGEAVSAQKIFLNLDSSQGKLDKVYGMVQPTISYEANSVEKQSDSVYSLEKARITSCTQPVPRWSFTCSKANFKKNDYIQMWNAVVSIKKVPVFYWPYLRYPLNQERSTGFLMPQIGYSGRKGFIFSQHFYWAAKRNVDATFSLDYYSAQGLGAGTEVRYLLGQGSGGQLNLFYFNFKNQPGQVVQKNASLIRMNHNQRLPLDFNLVAHIDYNTSFDFLRQFDNNFQRAVISNRNSQVYLSRAWSYFNFSARVSRFETYFSQLGNSIITTNLPQISFNVFRVKLFSPLYFSFNSSFNSWQYGWNYDYDLGKQKKSQSLTLSPSLSLPFTEIPWLTLNPTAGVSLTYYAQSYKPYSTRVVDEPLLTTNYNLNVELVGPVFTKIYRDSENNPKLKHIIEPTFTYSYQSPVTSPDRIITPYGFYRNDQINYTLVNHFLIKKDEMPREMFTLGIGQTYYFSPQDSPLRVYQIEGKIPSFSDVTSYLRFYPGADYSVDFSAGFNTYIKTFSSIRLGANLGKPRDRFFLRVNWYKSINPYISKQTYFNRHQINFYSGLKIPGVPLEGQVELDYNIQQRKMLYSAFSFTYDYQCMEFKADFRIFYFRNQPEVQFRISLGLGNIGKSTDLLGGIGF